MSEKVGFMATPAAGCKEAHVLAAATPASARFIPVAAPPVAGEPSLPGLGVTLGGPRPAHHPVLVVESRGAHRVFAPSLAVTSRIRRMAHPSPRRCRRQGQGAAGGGRLVLGPGKADACTANAEAL